MEGWLPPYLGGRPGAHNRSEQLVYEPDQVVMRFVATEGLVPVRCGILIAALEGDALSGLDAMLVTYFRNRKLIQEIAQHKYRIRRVETKTCVVVRLEDVTAQRSPRWSIRRAATWSPGAGAAGRVVDVFN